MPGRKWLILFFGSLLITVATGARVDCNLTLPPIFIDDDDEDCISLCDVDDDECIALCEDD